MDKEACTGCGSLLKIAKEEYLFDHNLSKIGWLPIVKRYLKDPLFRANVYINWLQQPGKTKGKKRIRRRLETQYGFIISLNSKVGKHFRVYSTEGNVIGEGVEIGDR